MIDPTAITAHGLYPTAEAARLVGKCAEWFPRLAARHGVKPTNGEKAKPKLWRGADLWALIGGAPPLVPVSVVNKRSAAAHERIVAARKRKAPATGR